MAMKNRLCWFIVGILVILPSVTFAVNIDPDNDGSHFAWGENVGWLNLKPGGNSGLGVEVSSSYLTGFIWGENIGWISLSCLNTGNCATVNYGVVNDGVGNLLGDAWGENVGWINFDWVIINPITGVFSGYAWGENIGWINFAPAGRIIKTSWLNPGACTDSDGDGYAFQGGSCGPADCNDNDPLEHPNQIWYEDRDNDGYSSGATIVQCPRPAYYKVTSELTAVSGDCDDGNPVINPGVTEVCDGLDNNCDDQIDEGLTTAYYQDADGDGYGDPVVSVQACTQPQGYVLDNTDCNDSDLNEHPNQIWYKDEDNDGYSDGTQTISCTRPVGYKVVSELTSTSGDCNDKNPAINVVQGTCGIIDPENNDSQYAWGENVGWINFAPSQGPGVNVTDTGLFGYALGENIGWINLKPTSGGVLNDGAGNLSGYAWGENVGWINFAPTGSGVYIDPTTGVFSGYAWGENIGWINFGPTSGGVKTSWRSSGPMPVAYDQTVTTDEDTQVEITLTGSDPIGNPLTFIVVGGPFHGALSGTPPNLTYLPNYNYFGLDSFTFRVNNGTLNSNTATINITINPVNDPPTANGQSVTTDQGNAIAITLTGSDVDGDALSFIIESQPLNGSLSGVAPNLTYNPHASFVGSDSFTFKVNDGQVDSNIATVSITINPVNDPPVANDQEVMTNEDTSIAINLTASDPENDPLTFEVVNGPSHGTLSGTAPNLTYSPTTNYNGQDSFTFRANDGSLNSNLATVSITVTSMNDAPAANSQSVTTDEDIAKFIMLKASDVDGDSLTYSIVIPPGHGSLIGTPPNVTYTPADNYNGSDSFTFKANDGNVDSNIATVSITVNAVNDAPVANGQSITTNEDAPVAVTLMGSDVDGNPVIFNIVSQPTRGTLSGTAPNMTYTPNANYYGSDSFTFKVNDGHLDSNIATVSITINSVNDPPTAMNDNYSVNEDITLNVTAAGVLSNDTDTEGDPLSAVLVSNPNHGTLTLNANGSFTYTPNLNYNGLESFSYRTNDGNANSNIATVSINVIAINDAPVANNQLVTTNENTPRNITLTASDVDGNTLTYSIVSGPAHGTLTGIPPNVTYTPNPNYSGPDNFTFKANDGTLDSNIADISITVNPFAYLFFGFFRPVDNPPIVNEAKAGQAIPLKWRITDTNGIPIADPTSFKGLTSYRISCDSLEGDPAEAVEEYAAGSSGLQYLGDGNWQFNWKTPKTYAKQCRIMILTLDDGSAHNANFKFK